MSVMWMNTAGDRGKTSKTLSMIKILKFYFGCGIFLSLIDYLSVMDKWGTPEAMFGFSVALMFVFLLYVPLCLVIACLLYHYNINKSILSNIILGMAYCAFPILLAYLLDKYSCLPGILSKVGLRDYTFFIVFIMQNVIIIVYGLIKRRKKKS